LFGVSQVINLDAGCWILDAGCCFPAHVVGARIVGWVERSETQQFEIL
jgi:hypothetical protein